MKTQKTKKPAAQNLTAPSAKQVTFLSKYFDADVIATKTRTECSAKIKEIIEAQRASRNEPATKAQIAFLADNGYAPALMALRTKGFCSALIYKIKSGKAA